MESAENLNENLKRNEKNLKRKGNPNPVCNLPKHYMEKGAPAQPGAGRPKKTDEQRRREEEERELLNAVHTLRMRNLSVLKILDKSEAYDDILLRTLESGARTGNPSALKFLNEILGNIPSKEQPKPSIQIKILNRFS